MVVTGYLSKKEMKLRGASSDTFWIFKKRSAQNGSQSLLVFMVI
jgi:hypothetical protein